MTTVCQNNSRGVHLQVETVRLAGTLMLLLMTANTLMLYSMPASRPEIVQVVALPGILISSCTPDRETGKSFLKRSCVCFQDILNQLKFIFFLDWKGQHSSVLTSSAAWCVGH